MAPRLLYPCPLKRVINDGRRAVFGSIELPVPHQKKARLPLVGSGKQSQGKVEKSERDSDIEEEQTESIDLKHKHKSRVQESIAAGLPRIQYLMPSYLMLACFTYKDL